MAASKVKTIETKRKKSHSLIDDDQIPIDVSVDVSKEKRGSEIESEDIVTAVEKEKKEALNVKHSLITRTARLEQTEWMNQKRRRRKNLRKGRRRNM